jgi:hypothetical protein
LNPPHKGGFFNWVCIYHYEDLHSPTIHFGPIGFSLA